MVTNATDPLNKKNIAHAIVTFLTYGISLSEKLGSLNLAIFSTIVWELKRLDANTVNKTALTITG